MIVALIAVGSELLHFGQSDTNSEWLVERLLRLGARTAVRVAVDDDVERIAEVVRSGAASADVVLVSGGLGPTGDDRSRAALARALGVELERDEEMVVALRRRYEERGLQMRAGQRGMADRPAGSGWLSNSVGTAPGIIWEQTDARIYALPGVPAELKAMFIAEVEPRLRADVGGSRLAARSWRVGGRSESGVDREIHDLYERRDLDLTVLGRATGVEIRVLVEAESEPAGERALKLVEEELRTRFGEDWIGREDETLESVVAAALAGSGQTLAVAESCTAGMLAATLTTVPGASTWFRGGVVVYHDTLKSELLGVDPELLAARGAVDPEVALSLARGVTVRCGATVGVGISGIAGPDGGTPDKPVGLVHVAIAGALGEHRRELRLGGGRELIRRRAVTATLDLLRRQLPPVGGTR